MLPIKTSEPITHAEASVWCIGNILLGKWQDAVGVIAHCLKPWYYAAFRALPKVNCLPAIGVTMYSENDGVMRTGFGAVINTLSLDHICIDRPMTKEIFEIYIETGLAPTLEAGDVVILDNLPSHKSDKARAILKERGAWFLFLPPYSPDLNPIEMALPKLKAHLRRIVARTSDDLWKAPGYGSD